MASMHGHFDTGQPGMRSKRSRAFTIFELTVAIGLLAVLMMTSVQMLQLLMRQQRAVERKVLALHTVQAVAELVGNIRWDELSPAAVEAITIPERVKLHLPGAKLTIALAEEADPVSKRISIELSLDSSAGQPAGTTQLTTWAFPEQSPPPGQ
jgi:hypothetical protein